MRSSFAIGALPGLALWVAMASPGAAAGEAAAPPLDISEYVVDGNTLLPQIAVEQAVYPFLGPERRREDLEAARAALEAAYRDRGFQTVAVTLSDAEPVDGVVHLAVSEQPVGRLHVVGAEYHSPAGIKSEAPSLAPGQVPNFNDVQRDIANLNTWPDRTVTPVLKAGRTPGTIDVDLKVDDQPPVSGSVELNNQQSQGTSPLRLNASFSYDNLWQLGHSLGLNFQVAPENPSDAKVFIGSYTVRFAESPITLQLTGMVSDSNVATLGGTDVLGNGEAVGLHGTLPLPGTDDYTQILTAEVDFKHFRNETGLGGTKSVTPITYYPLTLGYSGTLAEKDAVNQGDLSVTMASPELGSPRPEYDLTRYASRGTDFYLKGDLSRLSHLPYGIDVYLRLAGQLTDEPLITNEQYPVGGMSTVRGYLEAEALGDLGYSGTFELRSPPLVPLLDLPGDVADVLTDWHSLLFFDGAQVFLRQALPEQRRSYGLKSVGVGTQLALLHRLNASLILAVPMLSTQFTDAYTKRLLFRLWTEF